MAFAPAFKFFIEFVLFTSLFLFVESKKASEKPHVIIFVADDLGFGDVGYNGDDHISTPNIDALAADGIILNKYYAAPVCSPSRGALLSGVHPIHSGTQNYVILTAEPRGLPLNISLLPSHLKKHGYATHAVGKWHLGFFKKEYTPTFRGFDSHVGYWTGAEDYYDHTALEDRTSWGLDFRHNLDLIKNASGIYSTDYFTKRCLELISNHNKSKPLFMYMAYQSVHGANHYARLQAPTELIKLFPNIKNNNRRIFAAMLLSMDLSIGTIFEALHKRNMLENSIIIFTSDNGGPASGFTGNAASNWPLRGVKATLWEGGVRVPAFIWSPLLKKSGYVSEAMMHITDWFPTVLEAVTGKNFESERIYGRSMWQTLSNNSSSPRNEILHNIDPIWNVSAITVNEWKLVQGLVFPKWSGWYPPLGTFLPSKPRVESKAEQVLKFLNRTPKYTIFENTRVRCGKKPPNASTNCKPDIEPCLFHIASDPCEYNNVAQLYPQIVKELFSKIETFNKTSVRPGNQPLDPCSWPPLHHYSWSNWKDDGMC
ncbi:arylsulfatase B-like protein [Dinothrombium tinctorium]|uniref:Arylsulfatase B-like protein n=1 Tax=Dinothrombium tinctorium TaxID=1965070 RepID=A0A443RI49_9ACAR|nr:arylsulfatase B-like protein [Dinothrombium tinctorium]